MGLLSREGKDADATNHSRRDAQGLAEVLERENFQDAPDGRAADPDAAEKVEAANALAELPGETRADSLAAGLSSPAPDVRAAVLEALGRIGDPEAQQTLGATLGTLADVRDELGRSVALQALLARHDMSGRELVNALTQPRDGFVIDLEHKAALATMVESEDDAGLRDVTDTLVSSLSDSDEGRRTAARELLVSLGEKAVDPAVAAMDRPEARREAAIVLGRLRNVRAVTRLVDSLDDESPPVRAAAAWALGEIRDPIAIEPLTPLTRDSSYNVRAAASNAINAFGNVAVLAHVSSLLVPVIEELERGNLGPGRAALPAALENSKPTLENPPENSQPAPENSQPAASQPVRPMSPRRALGRLVRERLGMS